MYRQIYLRKRGKYMSYQMDLHGVRESDYHTWIGEMDKGELAQVWKYRHAGEKGIEAWFSRIDQDKFRSYLLNPFQHQPEKGMSTRFSLNFKKRR